MKLIDLRVAASTVLLVSTSLPLAAVAAGGERRQLDAHEHGVTTLNIALEDSDLILELDGPAINFVGFEHPPRTNDQKQAVADALTFLESDSRLFQGDADADCVPVEAEVQHITDADDDEDHSDHDEHSDHDADHEAEAQHSEFVGRYRYRCEQSARLTELRVGLFERFPLTDEVAASFIGPEVQTFETLTPDDPVLGLRP